MELYRYERGNSSESYFDSTIYVKAYQVLSETPKGYQIRTGYELFKNGRQKTTWVSNSSAKRYAYPTKEEALTAFIFRTKRCILIQSNALAHSQGFLLAAEKLKESGILPDPRKLT